MTEDELVCRTLRRETDAAAEARIAAADECLKLLSWRTDRMQCSPSKDGLQLVTAYGDVVCTSEHKEFIQWLHWCAASSVRAARNAHAAVTFAESVLSDRRNYKLEMETAQKERGLAVARLKLLTEEQDGKPGETRQFCFWLDGVKDTYEMMEPARTLAHDVGGRLVRGMPFVSSAYRKITAHIEYTSRSGINITRLIKRGLLAAYNRNVFFYAGGIAVMEAGDLQNGWLDPEVLIRHPGLATDDEYSKDGVRTPDGNGDFGDR